LRKLFTLTVIAVLAAFVLPVALWAYPSALNLAPCADILGANQLRIAYESDGHNQPYDDGNLEYIYTQIGIGGKFEFGVDFYDVRHASDKFFNAKYLVTAEKENTPAIAIGTRNISDVSKTSYYALGCKTYGKARLHFGGETQDGVTTGILGTDYLLAKGVSFLADYQSGQTHYSTAGVYWQATPAIGFNLYWARNNTSALRDTYDYVGAYAAYTLTLK